MEMNRIAPAEETICTVEEQVAVHIKKPKRILHFSDGILEEYSDSDEDENKNKRNPEQQNTDIVEANLTWGPWALHKATGTGKTFLSGCNYVGEAIASFLGITTPKYHYEIEAFRKMQEEKAKLEKEKKEAAHWHESIKLKNDEVITKEPEQRF